MRFVVPTIILIIFGLSLNYIFKDIFPNIYKSCYYIWDKTKDFMLVYCLASIISLEKYKCLVKTLYSLAGFLLIRIIWDVFAIQDYEWASSFHIMGLLFILFIATIGIIIYINCEPSKTNN